nr:MetaGeneMark_Unknown Function [uncultured bacterium]
MINVGVLRQADLAGEGRLG